MKRAIVAVCALLACRSGEPHEHASEHPAGHDHHEEGHGHGDAAVAGITRWSAGYELFAEHPVPVAGQELTLLAHLTVLEGFKPLDRGEVRLDLTGPAQVTASGTLERPGIFRIRVVPPRAGTYRGSLNITGPPADVIGDLEIVVHESEAARTAASDDEEEDGGTIEFLKEQQWSVPFQTAFAAEATLVPAIEVSGSVETPPGGTAEVGAPVAGRLVAPPAGLPRPGQVVKKGQLLAQLVPAPAAPEDAARAGLAVTEADARAEAARAALARAERLLRDEATSERAVEDARREVSVAEAAARSARQARSLFSGASGGGSGGGWRLVAPIAGTLVAVDASPGKVAEPGAVLFRIVDAREMWIRARVPEQDAVRLRSDRDAAYQMSGLDAWLPLDVTPPDAGARVVTVSRVVDPASRTVDVIYALTSPDERLRVGALVRVSIPAGDDFTGLVVPRGAVLEDAGRALVYVQVDGEHFAERQITIGPRAGGRVGVVRGIAAGERVVVEGANLVRLADRAGSGVPHGHIH